MIRRSRWLPAAPAVVLAADAAFVLTRDRDDQPTKEDTSPDAPITWPL